MGSGHRISGLWGLFEQRRDSRPYGPLLVTDDVTWTAEELGVRIDACAAALAARGIGRRDHVALMLDNSADFVATFFAVAKLGAVAVTLNTGLREDSLRHVLSHCDPRVLIVESELEAVAASVAAESKCLEETIARGAPLERALAEQEGNEVLPAAERQPGETAAILYTSGTTGLPKGVQLTDHGYIRASGRFVEEMRLGEDDVLHTCLPLFHINAQQLSLCGALACGGTLVLDGRFSASRFWDSIGRHNVTAFNLIGAMLGILHSRPPSPEERHHHARVACVAPVPASIGQECEQRFGMMLLDGYGLTETTPAIAFTPYGQSRPASFGVAAPDIELRVAGPEGETLPTRQQGELLVRPREPHVMMNGYYKDPAATAPALRDGWFHTGDRGWMDDDGYFYFVDRIKDVIRRRGENISASEIELAVQTHAGVHEVAAVGLPSDLAGGEDDVAVFVLPRPTVTITPEEIVAVCEARLASFMVPRFVSIVEEFPRTETQRIQKFALRERGSEGCFDRESASSA